MTNCKAGDLAVVVNASDCEANRGRIIRVTKLAELPGLFGLAAMVQGRVFWEFEGNLVCSDGDRADMVDDSVLKPIRDNPGADETMTWAGKPKKTPITVTSEYEAARIAESTPGAHVLVVRNDVLVSEFFGEV